MCIHTLPVKNKCFQFYDETDNLDWDNYFNYTLWIIMKQRNELISLIVNICDGFKLMWDTFRLVFMFELLCTINTMADVTWMHYRVKYLQLKIKLIHGAI